MADEKGTALRLGHITYSNCFPVHARVIDCGPPAGGEVVEGVESREELALGQTPQAFRTAALREAHANAEAVGASFTDDASMLRWAGYEVLAVPGDPDNVKITTLADLAHADRRMGAAGG